MKAWGRLLRLSLAPSALADVAAGAVWAQGGFHPTGSGLWTLMLASACVYHGGMALNDWADRAHDARTRPDRPIPSGSVSARAALLVALLLLAFGVFLAWRVASACGAWMSAVAVFAVVYDLAGRGAWLGPLLLALCRAGNLGAGILLGLAHGTTHSEAHVELQPLVLLPALLYGAYVFCVSRVGRLEDAEDGADFDPGAWPWIALGVLVLVPVLPYAPVEWNVIYDLVPVEDAHAPFDALVFRGAALALVAGALAGPVRLLATTRAWTRALVLRSMGMLLRRLLVFTAALALARGTLDGAIVAGAILCGYPLSFALRKAFPPS